MKILVYNPNLDFLCTCKANPTKRGGIKQAGGEKGVFPNRCKIVNGKGKPIVLEIQLFGNVLRHQQSV